MEQDRDSHMDMISNLPDCLIHLIMSFLTAQEAVRTCIFSKRWKNLWTTLPFLDFDVDKFEYDSDSANGILQRDIFDAFLHFVSTMLLLRQDSDLNKLHLSCAAVSHFDIIKSWIFYALKHNLQVLNIDHMPGCSLLPLGVFTCASLVDASLDCIQPEHNIDVISLPCLRRLSLKWFDINQDFVDKLFSGCPMLEFLNLEECFRGFSTIKSQSLKYLKLENPCFYRLGRKMMELINTPNLLFFRDSICPYLNGQKMPLRVPSLISASIHMDWCDCNWPYQYKSNIFIGLSHVQTLELSGDGVKDYLENELSDCPEFSNVNDLSVDGLCLSCHLNLLVSFLEHFPNLEKLSLYHLGCSYEVPVHVNQELLKITSLKSKKLKPVEVKLSKSNGSFVRCRVAK